MWKNKKTYIYLQIIIQFQSMLFLKTEYLQSTDKHNKKPAK